jgi:hypothetical protein
MAYTPDIDFVQHDLHDNDWIGVVVNNKDTTFSGRAQIRVLGLMDNTLPEHIPWAVPINSTIFAGDGAGSLSIPKLGQFVRVQFNNGDIYAPEYTTIQNIDTDLIQRIKDDYPGTHVLLHDPMEELTVIYQPKSGFQIYHKESFIQITPDTLITLQTPNGDSLIQMDGDVINVATKNEVKIAAAAKVEVTADEVVVNGAQATKIGSGPYQRGVAGEALIALLSTMASALDSKMPCTPGINVGLVEAAKSSILSTNVFISI